MKYKICVISLLDILGFKKIVEKNKDPKMISTILKNFKYFSKPDKDLARVYQQSFANFSDLSVRTINVLSSLNKGNPFGIVSTELEDLLHIQLNLVNQGIFIRGSITIDDIYLSSSLAFGPGLIKAYDLERIEAKYPRIIVDKDLLKLVKSVTLLKTSHHTSKEEIKYIKDILKKDKNGTWFIDYLKGAETETDNEHEYYSFLMKHKNLIIQNYKNSGDDKKAKSKFLWLKQYHNNYIKNKGSQFFRYNGGQISSYFIKNLKNV